MAHIRPSLQASLLTEITISTMKGIPLNKSLLHVFIATNMSISTSTWGFDVDKVFAMMADVLNS